jgi:hypothetical protein
MKQFRALMIALALSAFLLPVAQASSVHRKPTSASTKKCKSHKPCKTKRGGHVMHGQQAIDSTRATEIQQALIREHYMSGTPSGAWDDDSRAAMVRYQAANGWQTKVIPDSRAIIKLGLGPEAAVALPAGESSSATTAATAPPVAVRTPINPAAQQPASGKSPTLGSAITAHNNQQNFIAPE